MPIKPVMPRTRKAVDTSTYTGRFAVRLRSLREKRGMSVEELAEASGVPDKTLYRWESADSAPDIEKFPQLAEALGIKPRTLLPEG